MKYLTVISILLVLSISCYAQESQESHTLLLLEFENRSGIENPLLADLNDTISFVLSRQSGPTQIYLIPTPDRDALLARAAAMQPDATPSEQGLLVAEWLDADALVAGSYTKQEKQWSLEARVYHRREESKTRQDIQIQGGSLYQVLDDFPAHLLQQFTDAGHISLTTGSWKAYEEFRKGHQDCENYNFFGALEHYDNALALDPTLALAYAEKSYAHAVIGQREQATMAIEAARNWMSKASPMEQLAVRALDFTWDSERNEPREMFEIWDLYDVEHLPSPSFAWTAPLILSPGGIWDEPLIYQLVAFDCMQNGKREEANQHRQQWFNTMQPRLQAHSEDALFLHQTAVYCAGIGEYVDEAINMELKAIELNSEANWREERYILSRLYELKGDIEQSLEWARRHISYWPDPRSFPPDQTLPLALEGASFAIPGKHTYVWDHLAASMNEGKIPPERLLRWCEDLLSVPELHQPFRIRTLYLLAEVYHAMNNDAKTMEVLTSIGAPREDDWMAIGPLDVAKSSLSPETPPFEMLFADLEATHIGVFDEEMRWEPWEDEQPMDGFINVWGKFNKKYYNKWLGFDFPISSIAYCCIYVETAEAVDGQLRFGSATTRIWMNDDPSPVAQLHVFSTPIIDQKTADISLSAGRNRFLVSMVSSTSWAFYFRITDRNGKAIPGLKYVSAREMLASH